MEVVHLDMQADGQGVCRAFHVLEDVAVWKAILDEGATKKGQVVAGRVEVGDWALCVVFAGVVW
jgi:uracil phosphoribosyltransferase